MSGSVWFKSYDGVERQRVPDLQRLVATNLQRPFQGFKNIRGTGPWVPATPPPRAMVRRRFAAGVVGRTDDGFQQECGNPLLTRARSNIVSRPCNRNFNAGKRFSPS